MKIKEKINLILVWIFPVIAIWLYPRYKYMSLGKYDMFAAGMYNFYIGNILACLVAIMLIQIWKNLRLWTKWHLLACLCNLVLFGYVGVGLFLINLGKMFPVGVFIVSDIRNLIFVETIYLFFLIKKLKRSDVDLKRIYGIL